MLRSISRSTTTSTSHLLRPSSVQIRTLADKHPSIAAQEAHKAAQDYGNENTNQEVHTSPSHNRQRNSQANIPFPVQPSCALPKWLNRQTSHTRELHRPNRLQTRRIIRPAWPTAAKARQTILFYPPIINALLLASTVAPLLVASFPVLAPAVPVLATAVTFDSGAAACGR